MKKITRSLSVDTLPVALVGWGRLGGWHAQKILRDHRIELVAIIEPDQNRWSACQDLYPQCALCESYQDEELLCLLKGGAVVVAASTPVHEEIVTYFLQHSISV